MRRIEFPVTGNLRPGDVLRTVYLDKDTCSVRDTEAAEGRNLFEIALDDYEPGCTQELWDLTGAGAFVHRDWRDSLVLPNLLISQETEVSPRKFVLASQDGMKIDTIDDGRQQIIFEKILRSSQYMPMSMDDYRAWVEQYKHWHSRKRRFQQESE